MKATPMSIDRRLWMMGLATVVLAGMGLVRVAAAGEGKTVFADDFEAPSDQSPPANWAMWGASRTKCPPTTHGMPRNGMGDRRVSESIIQPEHTGMSCPRPTARFGHNGG